MKNVLQTEIKSHYPGKLLHSLSQQVTAISVPLAMFLKTGPCHERQCLVQPSIRHRHLLWACQPAEKRVVTPVGGNTFSQLGLTCCLARVGTSWAGGHSPTRATSFLLQGPPPSLLPAVVLCTAFDAPWVLR